MGALVLLAVEVLLTLLVIQDSHDLVVHPISAGAIGGGTQVQAVRAGTRFSPRCKNWSSGRFAIRYDALPLVAPVSLEGF